MSFVLKIVELVQLCLIRKFVVSWQKYYPRVNANISISLSVNVQQTNVQRSFFISGLENNLKTT